jgi:hypothetical protein
MYWLVCVGFLYTSNSSDPSGWRRMVRSSMLMWLPSSLSKVHLMFAWMELRKASLLKTLSKYQPPALRNMDNFKHLFY